jgi:hypothetical protein
MTIHSGEFEGKGLDQDEKIGVVRDIMAGDWRIGGRGIGQREVQRA